MGNFGLHYTHEITHVLWDIFTNQSAILLITGHSRLIVHCTICVLYVVMKFVCVLMHFLSFDTTTYTIPLLAVIILFID